MSPTEAPKALVFDIQRLALDDGPGIRTTIFFKGCPLRCAWCHNPESISGAPQLSFNPQLCIGCRRCEAVCTHGVHRFEPVGGEIRHVVDHPSCVGSGACVAACPQDALSLAGREYTIEDLLAEVRTDLPYYRIGEGGGITLSGGEPMAQFRFVRAFLERTADIHVCMDTSGFAPSEHFAAVAPMVDLFLFDLKATDPAKHRALCGVDNSLILRNLDLLCALEADIVLRLPLVPGVNDDDEHFRGIQALKEKHPRIRYAQIMPYHNLGVSKLERFGILEPFLDLPTASSEEKSGWLKRLQALGVRDIRL